jgi:hypothetical protein
MVSLAGDVQQIAAAARYWQENVAGLWSAGTTFPIARKAMDAM